MDIVMISGGGRIQLVEQTLLSLESNAAHLSKHNIVLVLDGLDDTTLRFAEVDIKISSLNRRNGASASRNIGASSIPLYRRQRRVMFLDDDVYMCPAWDVRLEKVLDVLPNAVVSGHAHPFNLSQGLYEIEGVQMQAAQVLSTVHYAMPWDVWDKVGFFKEPGGVGGSEDVDWCARARELGVGMAVTEPQCVIHCGLTSSNGNRIVGYDLMVERNRRLVEQYGLKGVTWI